MPFFGNNAMLGAAGGFSPLDISACNLWLDAYQISGIANGDRIDPWPDLSGNNHDAGTGTHVATGTPKWYATAGWSGKPSVYVFEPTVSDGLRFQARAGTDSTHIAIPAASSMTMFFAVDVLAYGSPNPGFWRSNALNNAPQGNTFVALQGGTSRRPFVRWNNVTILQPTTGHQFATGKNIFAFRVVNAASVTVWSDGVEKYHATHAASNPALNIYDMAWQSNLTENIRGYWGEAVMYRAALSDNDVARVNNYLAEKWM